MAMKFGVIKWEEIELKELESGLARLSMSGETAD
jgi:hypothetical protein